MLASRVSPLTGLRPAAPARAVRLACKASADPENRTLAQKLALPMAAAAAALLVSGAFTPDEALAAKSSGRVGGGSGFAARRAPQSVSRSNTAAPRTVVNNTTVMVAPPVFSPFGFGGFGFMPFGGFMPVPIFGGLFQIFFLVMIASVVFSVIRNFTGGASNKGAGNKKDDGWGDL